MSGSRCDCLACRITNLAIDEIQQSRAAALPDMAWAASNLIALVQTSVIAEVRSFALATIIHQARETVAEFDKENVNTARSEDPRFASMHEAGHG